jgi:cytochrome P450
LLSALAAASADRATSARASAAEAAEAAARFIAQLAPPPPGFPPGPVGDSGVALAADPLDFIATAAGRYGGAVGLRLAGARAVLVSRAEWAEAVLITDADAYTKKGTAFFPGSSLAGEGLLVSDGDTWKRQRRLATPAFRAAAVASYATAMGCAATELLADTWQLKGRAVQPVQRDVYSDFNALTLRVVARALFGADVAGAAAAEINASIAEAFEFFARRTAAGPPPPEWLPTPDNARFAAAVARLDKAVYRLIATRRDQLAREGPARNGDADVPPADLLDALLRARDAGSSGDDAAFGGMGDVALRDELMTLLVAGQETSALVLTWTCAYIAQHPALAERLAAEADSVLGPSRAPGSADLARLPLTTAVVYESMRLSPPAYMVGRCAARDVQLGPWRVPAGTTLLVSPYLLHRQERHWGADALRFRPDRWLDAQGALLPDALRGMGARGAYVPFGAGPRNCIGAGFAMMEAVLITAAIARGAVLSIPPGMQPPAPAALITLRPAGATLQIAPRARSA